MEGQHLRGSPYRGGIIGSQIQKPHLQHSIYGKLPVSDLYFINFHIPVTVTDLQNPLSDRKTDLFLYFVL